MATAEWEARLTRLEEAAIVNGSLLNKLEQNVDRLELVVQRLAERVVAHEDGIAELRAFQAAVLERFDRFLRGQEGNGRKQ